MIKKLLFLLLPLVVWSACSSDEDIAQSQLLSTPVPTLVSSSTHEAVISWDKVPGATEYLYRLNDAEEQRTTLTSVTLSQLTADQSYTFQVKAIGNNGTSSDWNKLDFQLQQAGFTIDIPTDQLKAYAVTFSITPDNPEQSYYFNLISKEKWEREGLEKIQSELVQALHDMSNMMGISYEEALEKMLYKGEFKDLKNESGFKPDTDFYLYAFYWNASGEPSKEVCLKEFHTPAAQPSDETIQITFDDIQSQSMNVRITPSAGIDKYYYYFATTQEIDQFLAGLDADAFLSYEAMNKGIQLKDEQLRTQVALTPQTDYTAIIMAIDKEGNRFVARNSQQTAGQNNSDRVESELFTQLLGEWEGHQKINDLYTGTIDSKFKVRIVQKVEGLDYDYRAANQLVALVDGWNNNPYYGIPELTEQQIENPADKFGPKWLLNIAQGDVVTIDGQGKYSTLGWMFYGQCYLFNMTADGTQIDQQHDLTVQVSADRKTLTITSPQDLNGFYPGMAYNMTGIGWMAYQNGASPIVLTRP